MNAFPIINEITVVLTDGDRFARLTGPESRGKIPDKEWMLDVIARAIITAEEQGIPGMRLATPQEFTGFIAGELGLGRIKVAGCPKEWQGFTQAELDAAISKRREIAKEEGDEE